MKQAFLIFILLSFASCHRHTVSSLKKVDEDVPDKLLLSEVLNNLSCFWKNDSLANNGFRMLAYRHFLNAQIDNVTSSFLKDRLGAPIDSTGYGKDQFLFAYAYYKYNPSSSLCQKHTGSSLVLFVFNSKNNQLIELKTGSKD